MITRINIKNKDDYIWLIEFISQNFDSDFYVTENNSRIYIRTVKDLKVLFKNTIVMNGLKVDGEYAGFVLIWKSYGGDKKRYYVKLLANDEHIAGNLLKCLLWNYNWNLYTKISKTHKFITVFKKSGFKFAGGRGRQLLLKRDKMKDKIPIRKEEEEYNGTYTK